MLAQLAAMAGVVATWTLMSVVFAGLGMVVLPRARRADDVDGLLAPWWLGVCVGLALLQTWHLALPIDWRATCFLAVVAAVGWWRRLRGGEAPRLGVMPANRALTVLLVMFVVWMANRATGPGDFGDSGVYHIPGIRWANEQAIVPGLANLLDHLGLNNAIFLLNAACEIGFWHGRSNHLVNSLLITVGGLRSIVGLVRIWSAGARSEGAREGDSPSPVDAFAAAMFPPLVAVAVGPEVSSPTTDLGAGLMTTMAAFGLVRIALRPPDDGAAGARDALLVSASAAAAVCLKVSAIVTAPFTVLGLAWLLRRRGVAWPTILAIGCLPGMVLVGIWCVRGVILSGYPLFPSALLPIDVDWRFPVDRLDPFRMYATNSGLYFWLPPDEPPQDHYLPRTLGWAASWLAKSLRREPIAVIAPALVAGIALASAVVRRARSATVMPVGAPAAAWGGVFLPTVAGLVFWAVNCPAPRMGSWLLWTLAASAAALAADRGVLNGGRARLLAVVALLTLAAAALGHRTASWVHFHRATGQLAEISPIARGLWMSPGRDHGLHPYPPARYQTRTNRWGVTMHHAIGAPEVWWAPLPATHGTRSDLRFRRQSDLAQGFVTDRGPSPEERPAAIEESTIPETVAP